MTYAFTASQAETVKLWTTKDTRDAEKMQFFYPMMYAGDKGTARYLPEASKFKGMIKVFTEFKEGKTGSGITGDRLTIPHVPRVDAYGIEGDTQLRGSGSTQTITSQNLFFNYFATQLISPGPLSDARAILKFMDVCRPSLRDWYSRKLEEAFVLALWGLTSWTNTTVLKNWGQGVQAQTWLNDIQTFGTDSTDPLSGITYGGTATSDATIDATCVLTAQLLTKVQTTITEDRDIPMEPMKDDANQDTYAFLTSGRGVEQLLYDEDFRTAATRVLPSPSADNPLMKYGGWRYGNLQIITYPKCLQPSANVNRSIVCGADALFFGKVEDIGYFEDNADDAQLKKALSVRAAAGVKANKITPTGGTASRRNAHAVDHWSRT